MRQVGKEPDLTKIAGCCDYCLSSFSFCA
jgi:hypothetical protein